MMLCHPEWLFFEMGVVEFLPLYSCTLPKRGPCTMQPKDNNLSFINTIHTHAISAPGSSAGISVPDTGSHEQCNTVHSGHIQTVEEAEQSGEIQITIELNDWTLEGKSVVCVTLFTCVFLQRGD